MIKRVTAIFTVIGFVILAVPSISSLFVRTNLAYATVICVDKSNHTLVLSCSNPNAIDKSSIKTSPVPANANATASSKNPARIQLLFFRTDHTSGYIFTTHYVVWGRVANTGGASSAPISVRIACTSTSTGAPLYTTNIPLTPSVLRPGDIGTFSQPISSDDLQGTKYNFNCTAQPMEK